MSLHLIVETGFEVGKAIPNGKRMFIKKAVLSKR